MYEKGVAFIEAFRIRKGYKIDFEYVNTYRMWCEDVGYYVSTSANSVGAEREAFYCMGSNPLAKDYNQLILDVRKARTNLSKEIIEALLQLINDVYDQKKYFEEFKKYVEYEDEEKKIAKCPFNETEFVGYIDEEVTKFYERLEEILKDYLP